jgi:general secretion pathway protein N
MKTSRIVLACSAALVLTLAALVWFMPARLALPLLQSRLHGLRFEQVAGTIWQGQAGQVSMVGGSTLGSAAWTLSRRALIGDIQLGVELRQPQLQLHGQMHRLSPTEDEWQDVTLHVDMAMLGVQPWLHGQPQGTLDLQIAQAQLQGNWPMQVDATGHWSQAVVRTTQGTFPLGTFRLSIHGQSGVLQAALDDDGSGPVQTAGRLSFSPLGWDLRVNLKPRHSAPAFLRWLHTLGTPEPDGSVRLRYRGGLAQFNSPTGNP